MGISSNIIVAMNSIAIRRHDLFLICSDGLSGSLKDQEMLDIIIANTTLESACDRLVEAALKNGSVDDVTVVLAEVFGEGAPAMTINENTYNKISENQIAGVGALLGQTVDGQFQFKAVRVRDFVFCDQRRTERPKAVEGFSQKPLAGA